MAAKLIVLVAQPSKMEEKRKELEQHLENLIETLRHCIIIVEQFKPEESQSVFHDKL